MPEYIVPAKGTVEYAYFLLPKVFREDKWIDHSFHRSLTRMWAQQHLHHAARVELHTTSSEAASEELAVEELKRLR